MREKFQLGLGEPFTFKADGQTYKFSPTGALARKERVATNISEFVFKLPTGKHVYLTVVGDEDQRSDRGIERGWYVAEMLSDADAKFLIESLAPFTKLYSH